MSASAQTLGATVLRGDGLDSSGVYELPRGVSLTTRGEGDRASGTIVVAVAVGDAEGSRAAAAALACAGSEPDRAALLVECAPGRRPRPTLLATVGARALEERIAARLPQVSAASRGAICQVGLGTEEGWLDLLRALTPLAGETAIVVHLPPAELQPLLGGSAIRPGAALLRADLLDERALTALVATDLIGRGLRVGVLKRRLSWPLERAALFGALPADAALPARLRRRLLGGFAAGGGEDKG